MDASESQREREQVSSEDNQELSQRMLPPSPRDQPVVWLVLIGSIFVFAGIATGALNILRFGDLVIGTVLCVVGLAGLFKARYLIRSRVWNVVFIVLGLSAIARAFVDWL